VLARVVDFPILHAVLALARLVIPHPHPSFYFSSDVFCLEQLSNERSHVEDERYRGAGAAPELQVPRSGF